MADQVTTNTPEEDIGSTAASWLVAAILIAAVVIAGFYFLSSSNTPTIPNTGSDAELVTPDTSPTQSSPESEGAGESTQ